VVKPTAIAIKHEDGARNAIELGLDQQYQCLQNHFQRLVAGDHLQQMRLAATQLLLSLALGDVARHADQADDDTAVIAQRKFRRKPASRFSTDRGGDNLLDIEAGLPGRHDVLLEFEVATGGVEIEEVEIASTANALGILEAEAASDHGVGKYEAAVAILDVEEIRKLADDGLQSQVFDTVGGATVACRNKCFHGSDDPIGFVVCVVDIAAAGTRLIHDHSPGRR
jgi:hypothetical protein